MNLTERGLPYMAVTNNATGVRVRSRGHALWKEKEKREGKDITIDAVSKVTGLAKLTVRRFLVPTEQDVNGSSIVSAALLADYFGVGVGDLLEVQKQRQEVA